MSKHLLSGLLKKNAKWAAAIKKTDPDFFDKLSHQQSPEYLWIGCSDSRVPANQIVGLLPGEIFVHRNIANLVLHSDLNCLSVIQFAVDVLKIKHIIVCGHYSCSGIHAAIHNRKLGLADNWIRTVQEAYKRRCNAFRRIKKHKHWDAVCEMNVIDQVRNVALTTVVQDAWARKQHLSIHGWVYGLQDGIIRELMTDVSSNAALEKQYNATLKNSLQRHKH